MQTLIVGAGAIGCLVGGLLAQTDLPVTLVGRPRLVDAIRGRGLRLELPHQTFQVRAVAAFTTVDQALAHALEARRPVELAVLTVKSYDTATALDELDRALRGHGHPQPHLLSLQNGVGNEEALAERFGPERVIAGTITAPAEIPEPGTVRIGKARFAVGIAPWHRSACQGAERVQALWSRAGMAVTLYPDARAMKWTKLLMNMIGNATSAILAEPPGLTFQDPHIADLEIRALREALQVMAAQEIRPVNLERYPLGTAAPLLRRAPSRLLRPALRRIVSGARGGKMPSLYLDLERGKGKSEVRWLNGAVVRAGESLQLPTPVNRALTEIVLHLVSHPEEWPAWQGNHRRLVEAVRAYEEQA